MSRKSIRFGILSSANIGKKVSAAIHRSDHGQVVAVASRSLKTAEEFRDAIAQEGDNITAHGTYEELLRDANVDVVYVPLPSGLKKEWAIAVARHGKHVLAEKPFASSQDLQDIIAACRENHVVFMDNTMFVHNPRTKEICQLVARGELGPQTLHHTDFHFSLPKGSADIRLNPQLEPLGALGDLGWYNTMFAVVTGNYEVPAKVQATHVEWFNGTIYALSALLEYQDGRKATFNCGFEVVFSQPIRIGGPQKVLTLEDFVLPWGADEVVFPWGKDQPEQITCTYKVRDSHGVTTVHSVDLRKKSQETWLIEELCALVTKKKANKEDSSGEHWIKGSIATQKILDGLAESAKKGTAVEIH